MNTRSPSATIDSIELLAPAGNWQCARAAVENGADAIYFGLNVGFNARARADNFHLDDLPQLMEMLHRQAVRGYVTLNTLVFTDELAKLEEHVRLLAAAGVDAVLVQDLGAVGLIKNVCPEMEIHASTQMTLTNAESIEQVRELGVGRVVLARELSIREIADIHRATSMPLEVFVHGALCVAYSGQCLTSESLGGRSANRGQCAQACRLPYTIVCDDEVRDLGSQQYLLSPQDLAAHDLIPQLMEAGVCSMKIEGRLKTPEYVANVCSHYRRAIDQTLAGQHRRLTVAEQRDLELSFSRGFSPGWLEGCDHKRLVPGDSSSKRGVEIARIVHRTGERLAIQLCGPLATGDGIVIEGDRNANQEIGGRVYEMWVDGRRVNQAEQGVVQLALQKGILGNVIFNEGLRVFKTDDPQLTKRLRKTFESADPVKRVPIELHIRIECGQKIELTAWYQSDSGRSKAHSVRASDDSHNGLAEKSPSNNSVRSGEITIRSEHLPELARKHPIDETVLVEQFSRLGGSVYSLQKLDAEIVGQPMVPLSILGQLRRQLIEQLDQARVTRPLPCSNSPVAERLLAEAKSFHHQRECAVVITDQSSAQSSHGGLRILCRSLEQLRQVIATGAKQLIADFHDLRQYREALLMAGQADAVLELATLRIHKPGEDGLFHALRKHYAFARSKGIRCAWLVRNLAAVRYGRQHGIPFAADFSLNVTNPLTARTLLDWGASRLTTSYDLNRDQMIELVNSCIPSTLEVVVHQHMPMFHMEHCVFCSVLSPGKNKTDCGRPCDRHDVKLRDRVGADHVLHADIGCRNTLYNATAQSGAEAVAPLKNLGVKQFRIELLRDASEEQTRHLVHLYQELIAGKIDGASVWRELKADNRIGVTRGTMEQSRNPLAIL